LFLSGAFYFLGYFHRRNPMTTSHGATPATAEKMPDGANAIPFGKKIQ
jgi:hypothetical protein